MPRFRACAIALFFLASVSSCFAQKVGREAQSSRVEFTPEGLLIRSYILGNEFPREERVFHLVRLLDGSAVSEPVLTKLWAEELFNLTFQLPISHNRLAAQKNALVHLVRVDSERALELYALLDTPTPGENGFIAEDVRAYGARTIFGEVWKRNGSKSLDRLRLLAQQIGETGEYPCLAIVPILRDLSANDPILAEALFSEAVRYYSRGSRVQSADSEFVEFLQATSSFMPKPALRQGLTIVVERLKNPRDFDSEKGDIYRGRVYSEKQAIEFRTRADRLLFDLMPLVREVDPDWAKRLAVGRPELSNGAEPTSKAGSSEGVVIRGTAPPERVAALANMGMERSRLRHIESIVASDPDGALRLALSLTDSALRAEALSQIAVGFHPKSTEQSSQLLAEARKLISGIRDKESKVRALVALAQAYASLKDQKMFHDALTRGFDLGIELLQEDLDIHPTKTVIFANGFDELTKLARLGVRMEVDPTLDYVIQLRDQRLKAHLLIDCSQALRERAQTN